jgi:hypothetical protein
MPDGTIARTWRGVAAAVRTRPLTVVTIAAAVFVLDVMVPPFVLSLGTLALLSALSRVIGVVVLIGLGAGVVCLAWRVGACRPPVTWRPGESEPRASRVYK